MEDYMKQYVLGFLFNPEKTEVVLIKKNRPSWQAGKINGIGGLIEDNELLARAMKREFEEETGLEISDWHYFATMDCVSCIVHCFNASSEDYRKVKSNTDEEIIIIEIAKLHLHPIISNISWLVNMAIDPDHRFSSIANQRKQ